MPLVTREAPDFTAEAVLPDGTIESIKLSQYRGKYVILFFYPMDFTFVCPTELRAFSQACADFEKLNCQLLSVSVDSPYSHFAWRNTPATSGGVGELKYPMVSDITKHISRDYGVLTEAGVALRGLFLIDCQGVVRHELVNDMPLGRDVNEALRVLKALQFFEKHGEVCPAGWHEGDEAVKPTAEGIAAYLEKH